MKVEPANIVSENPITKLSKVEQTCYYAAIVVAFISVFVWAIKILVL